MDFDRTWTQFATEAEVERFGVCRIVDHVNSLTNERDRLRAAIMDGAKGTFAKSIDPVTMLAEERQTAHDEIAACNASIDTITRERDELARQLAVLADQCGPSCAKEIEDLRRERDEAVAELRHAMRALRYGAECSEMERLGKMTLDAAELNVVDELVENWLMQTADTEQQEDTDADTE
jgi:uncharacterized coiled-coil DUF342 family protein